MLADYPPEWDQPDLPETKPSTMVNTMNLPRVIEDMPFAEYLALDYPSSSSMWTLLQNSPAASRIEREPSPQMVVGTAVHALVLEKTDENILVRPDANRTTNAGKETLLNWLENATGKHSEAGAGEAAGKRLTARIADLEPQLEELNKTVLTQEQWDLARAMADAIERHPIARVLLSEGKAETTMLAQDPVTALTLRTRCDWLPAAHHAIVDLKTSRDATPDEFSRSCAKFGYALQAELYRYNHHLALGGPYPAFLHLVVESAPPHQVAIYELDSEALETGAEQMQRALDIWRKCVDANFWPGIGYDWGDNEYSISSLSLPRWALNK